MYNIADDALGLILAIVGGMTMPFSVRKGSLKALCQMGEYEVLKRWLLHKR